MPDNSINPTPRPPPAGSPDDQPEKPHQLTRDVIDEALAKQAAMRGHRSPPKIMPVTPTLPKQPRPARDRKRRRRKF